MFKVTITAGLSSKPHLTAAARKLEAMGAKRVRVDQYDSRHRHPRQSVTMAAARLRFAVETVDDFKRMIEATGLSNFGTSSIREKYSNDDEGNDDE